MTFSRWFTAVAAVAILLAAAYSNHFHNGFHFDDSHAIEDNTYVRSLSHIPRYFRDATTFSVLPQNQSYRPLLQTTFAIDYWLGGGYRPVAFQAQTFAWYLVLIVAIAALFESITANRWITLAASAVYALNPVCAETVNYIVQRGDLLSTLGVVAGLVAYVRWPGRRRQAWYLIPVVLGALVKPPALIFPVLVATYLSLFEKRTPIVRAIAPSVAVVILMAGWFTWMTPASATTGASNGGLYLWTQPFVALRYFLMFFAPIGLSADNDWSLVSGPFDWRVAAGLGFVALLAAAIRFSSRRDATKPIAFGLAWFALTLLPTSLTPLAEVANDHRMFFPFVGLSLAVTTAAALGLARVVAARSQAAVAAGVMTIVLLAGSAGVYARNEVWRSDETLWRDVTENSPNNGRGWMNYGLSLMERGDYDGALAAYRRAEPLTPNYHLLQINMALAYGGIGQSALVEPHFLRAVDLEPIDWRSHLYYALWLLRVGRAPDALAHARIARELNPGDAASLPVEQGAAVADNTPEYHLARSLAEYQMRRYRDSIGSARRAIALRPSYALAWNNVAAAHNALAEFEQGIAAGEEAVRLDPSLQIARNNVDYARRQLVNRKSP